MFLISLHYDMHFGNPHYLVVSIIFIFSNLHYKPFYRYKKNNIGTYLIYLLIIDLHKKLKKLNYFVISKVFSV